MEWQLNIPKILHVYWGGKTLNYLRFLTIKTFLKHNPDWKIRFLYPKEYTKGTSWVTYENKNTAWDVQDFMPEVKKLPIDLVMVDLQEYGVSNKISEVHKSDFVRLIQLSQYGGLWSDMDIFYIKPMTDFYLNVPENKDIETYICNNEYGHSIGFMMASQGNKFFASLSSLALREYEPYFYQTLGARLYNKYFSTMESIHRLSSAINISMDVVYPSRAGDEADLINGNAIRITDKTLGIHWFAGHPQWNDYFRATNGGIDAIPNSIIGNLIRKESI